MEIRKTSSIEISRSALEHNYKFIRKRIGKNTILCSVVKGNAYGHSIEKFVPLAESCGVKFFAVFSSHEAEQVMDVKSPDARLMVMGMIRNEDIPWAIKNDVEFYVFDFNRLESAVSHAKEMSKKSRIHIEIETGMNRTGFPKDQWERVAEILTKNADHLEIEGMCTHFAGAESIANFVRIQNQLLVFTEAKKYFSDLNITPKLYHSACSAAMLRYPETTMDLVRVGIVQYGYWPTTETYIQHLMETGKSTSRALRGLITWKTEVMDIKSVNSGEFISYGTSFLASKRMKIATVPVGYANGFARSLSNRGRVLINGQRCSVIGMVNMNMIIIDVTDMKNIEISDEVVLIGQQKKLKIKVSSFEDMDSFVNYELLTRMPKDIKRTIVD
ncbi:MAG: alanine racemase [Sphingobacteriales bacterium]|jgi:alanine racemase